MSVRLTSVAILSQSFLIMIQIDSTLHQRALQPMLWRLWRLYPKPGGSRCATTPDFCEENKTTSRNIMFASFGLKLVGENGVWHKSSWAINLYNGEFSLAWSHEKLQRNQHVVYKLHCCCTVCRKWHGCLENWEAKAGDAQFKLLWVWIWKLKNQIELSLGIVQDCWKTWNETQKIGDDSFTQKWQISLNQVWPAEMLRTTCKVPIILKSFSASSSNFLRYWCCTFVSTDFFLFLLCEYIKKEDRFVFYQYLCCIVMLKYAYKTHVMKQ